MQAVHLEIDDLRCFLDVNETTPTPQEMEKINYWYSIFCTNADIGEEEDYLCNYDVDDYYPPFVAQAINNVL